MHWMLAVLSKEFRHMLHDPVTLVLTFGLPVVQLLLYGFVLETRVQHVPTALLNFDRHATDLAVLVVFTEAAVAERAGVRGRAAARGGSRRH